MFEGKILKCKDCGLSPVFYQSDVPAQETKYFMGNRDCEQAFNSELFITGYQAINAWNRANATDELKEAWRKKGIE